MNKFYSKLPVLLLVLGGILRISGAGSAAIWYDESITLYRSGLPFMELISNKTELSGDILLDLLVRPFMAIDHHSLWLLRMPSLICGLVSLWLVFILMRHFKFNLIQQSITSALVAFMPGLIWMGQDARTYSLLTCVFLASIWFSINGRWLGMIACCGLMVYCHFIGVFYAISSLAIALYLYQTKIKSILLSCVMILISWTPALIMIIQCGNNYQATAPWSPLTINRFLGSFLSAIWTTLQTTWFILIALILLIASVALILSKHHWSTRIILLSGWAAPLIGMITFSLIFTSIVLYRTIMPILFMFSIWLGWELGSSISAYRLILAGLWVWMLLAGLVFWNPADRGGRLDLVANQIRSNWHPGDSLVYTTITTAFPFDYYLSDLSHQWNLVSNNLLLTNSSLKLPTKACDPNPCRRYWVVIPDEQYLYNLEDYQRINLLTQGTEPIYSVHYMQAARINVYLVEVDK